MEHKQLAAILTVIFLILILYMHFSAEHFNNKREKANAILQWFNNTKYPSYTKYQSSHDGNIVEYNDVMKLYRNRNLTLSSIESVL